MNIQSAYCETTKFTKHNAIPASIARKPIAPLVITSAAMPARVANPPTTLSIDKAPVASETAPVALLAPDVKDEPKVSLRDGREEHPVTTTNNNNMKK